MYCYHVPPFRTLCLLVFYHTATVIHLYIPRVPSQAVIWLFWCQVFVSEDHPVLLRETGFHSHCLLNKTPWFIICNALRFAFTSLLPNRAVGLSAPLCSIIQSLKCFAQTQATLHATTGRSTETWVHKAFHKDFSMDSQKLSYTHRLVY